MNLDELPELVTLSTGPLLRALEALDRAQAEVEAARALVMQAAGVLYKPTLDDARIAAGLGWLQGGATFDQLEALWPWPDLLERM